MDIKIGSLCWIHGSYIDDPNSYFQVTGWSVVPYLSFANVEDAVRWSIVIGIYDHNNGTPREGQLCVGTGAVRYRKRAAPGSWSAWGSF